MIQLATLVSHYRRYATERCLRQRGISFGSTPVFDGPRPNFLIQGQITLGKSCHFRCYRIRTIIAVMNGGSLEIGDGCFINDGVNIGASKQIVIGAFTKIADLAMIHDDSFHDVGPTSPRKNQPVIIGRNVWLGAASMVLPGVTIGDHSVVAAGAVVTKPIPARSVAAGVPAKVISTFECENDWVRP